MAALGKGISRSTGGGWRRCTTIAFLLALVLVNLSGIDGVASAPSDPLLPAQWNLAQIRAPEAWARSTGAGVRIGIVDTGVFAAHEDLAGKVVASTNCIGAAGDPNKCSGTGLDDNGHGTHVAGIAAAARNGRGIVGVAPDALLVVAKALNQDQGGTIADVEAGIRWVVRHGAQVVNLSIGDNPNARGTFTELSFRSAVEEAWNAGAIPIVAAGNPNSVGPGRESYANLHALVVGATNLGGVVAPYSNALTSVVWGLVAPGGSATGDTRDVVSTWWLKSNPASTSTYSYRGGASMAVPHASGVAALLLAEGLSRDQVVARILDTARPIGCGGACFGRLDAAAAVAPTPVQQPALDGRVSQVAGAAAQPRPVPHAPQSTAAAQVPTTAAVPAPTADGQADAASHVDPSPDAAQRDGSVTRPSNQRGWWAALFLALGMATVATVLSVRRTRLR